MDISVPISMDDDPDQLSCEMQLNAGKVTFL